MAKVKIYGSPQSRAARALWCARECGLDHEHVVLDMKSVKDPEFLADSEKQHLAVTPMTGAEVETFVKELYRTPPDIAAAAREISGD